MPHSILFKDPVVYEDYDQAVASFGLVQEDRPELYLIAAISSKLSTGPLNEIDCEK